MRYLILAIILAAFAFGTVTACGRHVPQPGHRPSERPAIPSPQLPEASPDGPVSSSGGWE